MPVETATVSALGAADQRYMLQGLCTCASCGGTLYPGGAAARALSRRVELELR